MFQQSLAYHTCIDIKQERAVKIKFVLIRKFECSFSMLRLQLYVIGGLAEMASFDNCLSSLPTIHVHKHWFATSVCYVCWQSIFFVKNMEVNMTSTLLMLF